MFSSKGCVRPSLISLFACNLVLSGSEGRVALFIVTSFASLVLTVAALVLNATGRAFKQDLFSAGAWLNM